MILNFYLLAFLSSIGLTSFVLKIFTKIQLIEKATHQKNYEEKVLLDLYKRFHDLWQFAEFDHMKSSPNESTSPAQKSKKLYVLVDRGAMRLIFDF